MKTLPNPLPVRCLKGRWQVLLESRNRWFVFPNESDARVFSKLMILEYKAAHGGYDSEGLARELDELAKLLQCGVLGFSSRFFEHAALNVRNRLAAAESRLD
jgi:hypothetical protein